MDQSSLLVTAIVSAYNAERFIAGCLEDLQRQTIASQVEIIVIDSGSSQHEGDIARDYQQRFNNIRYVRTEQRETIYQAWNRAISMAQGKYLTNANADDRHRPDAFEKLVSVLENEADVGVVYADSFVTNVENDTWPPSNVVGVFHWPGHEIRRMFEICYVGPHPMWRRSLHKVHGMFDGSLRSAGDYEFWLRLSVAGVRFAHLSEILGLYLASPTGVEISNQSLSHKEAVSAKLRHWPNRSGQLPSSSTTFLFSPLERTPLVTVVVPTLNRLRLLKDTLLSLVDQTYQHWEAIVVNDGGVSVDSVVAEIEHKGRIRLLDHWKCLGQARARNTALRVARGQIICYLDDDDKYLPEHLEGIVKSMQEIGSPFLFTGAIMVTENLQGENRIEVSRSDIEDSLKPPQSRLFAWNFIPLPTWAHRRECIEHVGFFDESMSSHEDWEFLLRFARLWELIHLKRSTVEIRVRPTANDSVTTRNSTAVLRDFLLVYRKHPTGSQEIEELRRKMLSELGDNSGTLFGYLCRPFRKFIDRHITWRINARAKPRQS